MSGWSFFTRLVAEAELVHRAGAEIFGHHVGGRDQLQHDLAARGRLQIDREAFLVAVVGRKEARAGRRQVARVVAVERLDLDHFGAEIGEHQAAGRPHHHVHEFDDAHAVERQFLLAHRQSPRRDRAVDCPWHAGRRDVAVERFVRYAFGSILRTAISLSRSTPVRKPIDSSRKTRSSVTMLPVAPGANGQPPRPPSEASKVRTPISSPASTLAKPEPARVVQCAGRRAVADFRLDQFVDAADLRRIGHAGGVGEPDFVATGFEARHREPQHFAFLDLALDGAAEHGRQAGFDLRPLVAAAIRRALRRCGALRRSSGQVSCARSTGCARG